MTDTTYPRTDIIVAELAKIDDMERLCAAAKIALSMMEYDLICATTKLAEVEEKLHFNQGIVKAIEVFMEKDR